jgi:hypothetical protein
MSTQVQPARPGDENGKVVAASTVAAGVAGGVAVWLNARRARRKEHDTLGRLIEGRKQELSNLQGSLEGQQRQLADVMAKVREQGEKHMRKPSLTAQDLAEFDWSGLSKRARKGLERAREEAAKRAPADLKDQREALVKSGESAMSTARELGHKATDAARRAPADLKDQRESLKKSGESAMATARDLGQRTAETLAKRLPEVRDSVESGLAPHARDLGERAATAATAMRQQSHDVAESVRERVEAARPEVEALAQQAKRSASKAPDAFATELKKAEQALSSIAGGVSEHAGDVAHVVEEKSRESALAVKRGGKEGTSLLLWSGIAAGVVYLAVLNEEQREQVKRFASAVIREAREIYADIQGENGEF